MWSVSGLYEIASGRYVIGSAFHSAAGNEKPGCLGVRHDPLMHDNVKLRYADSSIGSVPNDESVKPHEESSGRLSGSIVITKRMAGVASWPNKTCCGLPAE